MEAQETRICRSAQVMDSLSLPSSSTQPRRRRTPLPARGRALLSRLYPSHPFPSLALSRKGRPCPPRALWSHRSVRHLAIARRWLGQEHPPTLYFNLNPPPHAQLLCSKLVLALLRLPACATRLNPSHTGGPKRLHSRRRRMLRARPTHNSYITHAQEYMAVHAALAHPRIAGLVREL